MIRLQDWNIRLRQLVEERKSQPYEYGKTDCACFSFAAVEAVTGVVLFPGIERPKNWIGAAKFMMANGWSGIDEMMDSILERTTPEETYSGDLISFRSHGELHLAVRAGDTALTPSDSGLVTVDKDRWIQAWKVG